MTSPDVVGKKFIICHVSNYISSERNTKLLIGDRAERVKIL